LRSVSSSDEIGGGNRRERRKKAREKFRRQARIFGGELKQERSKSERKGGLLNAKGTHLDIWARVERKGGLAGGKDSLASQAPA